MTCRPPFWVQGQKRRLLEVKRRLLEVNPRVRSRNCKHHCRKTSSGLRHEQSSVFAKFHRGWPSPAPEAAGPPAASPSPSLAGAVCPSVARRHLEPCKGHWHRESETGYIQSAGGRGGLFSSRRAFELLSEALCLQH